MTFSTYFSPGVALQGGGGSGGGGAASLPISGNGATITTSTPLINGTQTWNNAAITFTSMQLNITDTASNAASLLMDLGTGGGSFVSRFRVNKSGVLTSASGGAATPQIILSANSGSGSALGNANGGSNLIFFGNDSGIIGNWQQFVGIVSSGVNVTSVGGINWSNNNSNVATTTDLFLRRRTTANLQLGAADAAAPVAQTLSVQSVVTGTSNTAGAAFTLALSQGTGTGLGGVFTIRGAPASSTGSVVNTLVDLFTVDPAGSARVVRALTVATLPVTPLTGMVARVTDALAPAVGTTVAGGGAAQALVWYNGANWAVIGV